MKRDYETEKAAKRRSTAKVMWLLLVLLILFSIVMIRVAARTGSSEPFFSVMPTGDDAYQIAKDYVRPTVKSPAEFAEDGFEFSKNPDSVYVVKSYFETRTDNHTKTKSYFKVRLKYNGGTINSDRNWSLLSMEEH